MFRSPYKYFWLTFLLIAIDQLIKYAIHHYLVYEGNEIAVFGHWFKLHYVLNRGMAFGMELSFIPGGYGKIVLSLFRLVAMVGIGIYLVKLARQKAHEGLLWSISAILGGAIGNVIDSTFYGKLLANQPAGSPTPWFHGQVIDMFFFDPYQGWIPDWVPLWGGSWYSTPIFNFADASIFCGVVSILIFQNKFFDQPKKEEITDDQDIRNSETEIIEDISPKKNEFLEE
ncbi:MAG: lipoprotein signal peptidase [Arcicella sp.]|nr:lipoprotein signal peptidase [Arcicella sp.]